MKGPGFTCSLDKLSVLGWWLSGWFSIFRSLSINALFAIVGLRWTDYTRVGYGLRQCFIGSYQHQRLGAQCIVEKTENGMKVEAVELQISFVA